jgi:hypothetical protein
VNPKHAEVAAPSGYWFLTRATEAGFEAESPRRTFAIALSEYKDRSEES